MKIIKTTKRFLICLVIFFLRVVITLQAAPEEFIGPFPSWTNLKTNYGAVGDGVADDTLALQAALSDLGVTTTILYLPAGTYRITNTINWFRNVGETGFAILGEDPATTTICWDGPAGGTMLWTKNVNLSRFGRITWDGNGTHGNAGIAIQHTAVPYTVGGPASSSGNEHADEVFQDVGIALRGGDPDTNMVAEMTVRRCKFYRCSRAGISVENSNSLDWWVWNCLFEDCYTGAASAFSSGQGVFHIFESIFKRSTFSDLVIVWGGSYCICNNYSINSRAFCMTSNSYNPLMTLLQTNTIIDPQLGANPPEPPEGGLNSFFTQYETQGPEGPVDIGFFGPTTAIDNAVRSRAGQSGFVFSMGDDGISVGNRFTVVNPVRSWFRLLSVDDQIVAPSSINSTEPLLPSAPPRIDPESRPLFEVAVGARATEIQTQINAAAAQSGQRPIVHLPAGVYDINRTLTIPANADVQVMGDGATRLHWKLTGGTMFLLTGPNRSTFSDLIIEPDPSQPALYRKGVGIKINTADQVGAKVFVQGGAAYGYTAGIFMNGLDQLYTELRSFSAGYESPTAPILSQVAFKVRGGPLLALGQSAPARMNIFGGTANGNILGWNVSQGGKLLGRAMWYEGSPARMIKLNGKGTLTLQGTLLGRYDEAPEGTCLDFNAFTGKACFLGMGFGDSIVDPVGNPHLRITNSTAATRVALLGSSSGGVFDIQNGSLNGQVGFLINREFESSQGSIPKNDYTRGAGVSPYAEFLRTVLAHSREERPQDPRSVATGVTDVGLYRVYSYNFNQCIQINR